MASKRNQLIFQKKDSTGHWLWLCPKSWCKDFSYVESELNIRLITWTHKGCFFVKKKICRNHLKMILSQQNCHCLFHWKMASEALSCILNFKNFLGEAPPYPHNKRGVSPPSRTLPLSRLWRSGSCLWHEQFSQFQSYRYFPNLVDKITAYWLFSLL